MKNFSVMLFPAALLLTAHNWVIADEVNTATAPVAQGENIPVPETPPPTKSAGEKSKRRLPPRLQQMKESLNLTNEQQDSWQQFEDTWVEQTRNMFALSLGKINNPLNAPERLQRQIAIMEQRLEALKKISVVQQALYQVLTPEQRTIMDITSASAPKPQIEIKPNPQPENPPTQSAPAPVLDKAVPESQPASEIQSSPAPSNSEQKPVNAQSESSPAPVPQPNSESQPAVEKKESTAEDKEDKKESPADEKKFDSAEEKKTDSLSASSNNNPSATATEKTETAQ